MDAEAFGGHIGKVQDVDRPLRIIRMRSVFEDRFETQTHDPDAVQFGWIGLTSGCDAGTDRRGGTDEKLPSPDPTVLDRYCHFGLRKPLCILTLRWWMCQFSSRNVARIPRLPHTGRCVCRTSRPRLRRSA